MTPSPQSPFQPPLSVDLTWNVDPSGQTPPFIRPYLAPFYDLLRRRVRPESSNESPYDFALRPGVGIPTLFGRPLDVIASEVATITSSSSSAMRVAIVLLEKNAERGPEAFRQSFDQLGELARSVPSRLLLLPVLIAPVWGGRSWPASPIDLTATKDNEREKAAQESVAIRLSQWLMAHKDERADAADHRVRVFVSHSKHRRSNDDISADSLKQMLRNEPRLGEFFEAVSIETHADAAQRLRRSGDNAILLCVRTDSYAECSLCQSQLLLAKELQIPTIMVTQLADGERRAPAYAGNMLNVVWQPQRKHALLEDLLRVWLHNLHFPLHAYAIAKLVGLPVDPVVVVRHPELVDFALGALPANVSSVVLYPDPPLPTVETQVLRQGYPRVRLTTPTTLFGDVLRNDDPAPPLVGLEVALSLSESALAGDPTERTTPKGLTRLHVDDVIAHMTLCLVRAGATLAYGGRPQDGYTNFLATLIDAHNQFGAREAKPLVNYLPAHSPAGVAPAGSIYTHTCTVGQEIDGSSAVCDALRYARVRQRMADKCDARIALAGKEVPAGADVPTSLSYGGRFPGIVEECWRTLEGEKPLYLIGGFGGAAQAVVEALLGRRSKILDEAAIRRGNPSFDALCRAYDADSRRLDGDPKTLDELGERIALFGSVFRGEHSNPNSVLWTNGLSVAENLRLFESHDVSEIVHLVLKGLRAHRVGMREPAQKKGELLVRLYHGNLADAPGVGAYFVGVMNGIRPRGDEAVLDERLGGAIRERIERLAVDDGDILASGGARLSGDWVGLIKLNEDTDGGAHIEDRLVETAKKHGLRNIALSPSAFDRRRTPVEMAGAILDAFGASTEAGSIVLTLCETSSGRFEELTSYVESREGDLKHHVLPPDPIVSTRTAVKVPLTLYITSSAERFTTTLFSPSDEDRPMVPRHTCARDAALEGLLAESRGGDSRGPPSFNTLERIGRELAERVFGELTGELSKFRDVPWDIVHDQDAGGIPWELLHIQRGKSGSALAERVFQPVLFGGLRRRLTERLKLININAGCLSVGPMRHILLLVNPLGDLPQAEREADALITELTRMKAGVVLHVLRGREVNRQNVGEVLSKQPWDVLHYAGHARFRRESRDTSGIILSDGVLKADSLKSLPYGVPPLIFLNACESARVRGEEAPSADNDEDAEQAHIGLAEGFLREGVRTLIGNFWRVPDGSARDFAKVVYEKLSQGAPIGEAVLSGRKLLFSANDSSWANYILYGDAEMHW